MKAPTVTTTNSSKEPSIPSPSHDRNRPPWHPRVSVWTRACDNKETRELVTTYRFTPHIRSRGEEMKDKLDIPGWRARRWVVEACHSWMNRNRAILIRWSKKDENHLAFLMLACGLIAFKKARVAALEAAPVAA